jgi:hypothetical protein
VIGGRCVGHANPDFGQRQTQVTPIVDFGKGSAAPGPPEIVALISADLIIGKDRQVSAGDLRHGSPNGELL